MVDEALRGVRAGGGEGGGEKGREGGLRPGMPAGTSEREGTGACHQNPLFVGIVLLVAGVAVAMIQYKVPTIMAPLMAQFSLDAQTASWLMSVFTLASIVMAIPSGMLAKRFGAKTMMVVACGIAVAGSVVGLFASMAPLLVVSRAIEGAALTILTTCGPLVVRQCDIRISIVWPWAYGASGAVSGPRWLRCWCPRCSRRRAFPGCGGRSRWWLLLLQRWCWCPYACRRTPTATKPPSRPSHSCARHWSGATRFCSSSGSRPSTYAFWRC